MAKFDWTTLIEVASGTAEAESATVITPAGVRGIWTHLNVTDIHGGTPSLRLGTRVVLPDGSVEEWILSGSIISGVGVASNFHTLQSPAGVTPLVGSVYVAECPIIPPIWRAFVDHGDTDPVSYTVSYIYDMG